MRGLFSPSGTTDSRRGDRRRSALRAAPDPRFGPPRFARAGAGWSAGASNARHAVIAVSFVSCLIIGTQSIIGLSLAAPRTAGPPRSSPADPAAKTSAFAALPWPDGTSLVRFEDLEGAILLRAHLLGAGGRDTSGTMVLDTGAGFLGLDSELGRRLGIADRPGRRGAIGLADRPLARFETDGWQVDQVSPVLMVDAGVISRVTGRPILGLIGQALLRDRILVVDYAAASCAVLPPATDAHLLPRWLSPAAVPIPFRLAGDGKAVLDAWIEPGTGPPRRVRLILDTGATKSVFFRPALERRVEGWRSWPRLEGLGAPTLTGDAAAGMTRVPLLRVGPPGRELVVRGMDAAVIGGELEKVLSDDVGEPIAGLLGYSFLEHWRFALDYPGRTLWLDPEHGAVPDRPFEYSHPGLQLEARTGRLVVYAVATGSPASRAGIRRGDVLVAIDGGRFGSAALVAAVRRLEGPPGSAVRLTIRRGSREWTLSVVRRRLL